MQEASFGSYEQIPLALIRLSHTNPRKRIDQAALEELTVSIRELGVTVPILLRFTPDSGDGPAIIRDNVAGQYEIVSGERRYRAALMSDLITIPAIVYEDLSDQDAMDLQLVENLQRADLHPAEEAEGYRALIAAGATAEDVAKKVGKTLGYVQQRLKLLTLEVEAKELFAQGHLTLGHALLLARLTPKDQQRALLNLLGIRDWEFDKKQTFRDNIAKHIANASGEYGKLHRGSRLSDVTEAQLATWIRSNVLLQLAGVPWDLGDPDLLPIAGPCTTCPKRTGANAALFHDLTTAEDTCTDPACFGEKQDATTRREQEHARSAGTPLLKISAKASHQKLETPAVEIGPGPLTANAKGLKVTPTKKAVVVTKKAVKAGQWVASSEGACPKTVRAIAVDGAQTGRTSWVCADQGCKVHKHQVERSFAGSGNRPGETWEQQEKRRREEVLEIEAKEKLVREAVFRAMEAAHGAGSEQFLRLLVANAIMRSNCVFVCRALGVEFKAPKRDWVANFEDCEAANEALLKALLTRPMSFVVEASFYSLAGQTLHIDAWLMKREPEEDRKGLWKCATMLGVDADAIAERVEQEQAAAAAPQISAAAEEPSAGKKAKEKLTASEQKTRKAATAKRHNRSVLNAEGKKAIADAMRKRWAEARAKSKPAPIDGKSRAAGELAEQEGA